MTVAGPPPSIVVLGAGFGALATVRMLRKHGCREPITVVSPQAELHYLPGIIWIPSGLRSRADLVVPLQPYFQRMGVTHVAASVTGARSAAARKTAQCMYGMACGHPSGQGLSGLCSSRPSCRHRPNAKLLAPAGT